MSNLNTMPYEQQTTLVIPFPLLDIHMLLSFSIILPEQVLQV